MAAQAQQIDVIATILQGRKVGGPAADAFMSAALSKLDKLGAKAGK